MHSFYNFAHRSFYRVALPGYHQAREVSQPMTHDKHQASERPRTQHVHAHPAAKLTPQGTLQDSQTSPEVFGLQSVGGITQASFLKHLVNERKAAWPVLYQVTTTCDDGNN